MSEITKEQLEKEINGILKNADLAAMSTKKVREQLEKKFKCDLDSRRQEIKEIVMDIVNSRESNDESESGSSEESEDEEDEKPAPKPAKRASTARKAPPPPKKKAKKASSEEEEEEESGAEENEDDDGDSDYNGGGKKAAAAPKGKKKGGRKKKGSDSDSDEDWKRPARPKKAKGAGGGGKGKGTGFTRPYQLSADLASVVGADSLPRYEVVKKIWTIIKERNLYDPKNKHFVICDNDQLTKVFGVKRFRAFSMLKYLKPHFLD